MTHDITGALKRIEEAFEAIVYNYPNVDLNHVDFRVKACKISEQALADCQAIRDAVPDGLGDAVYQRYPNMASQNHNINLTMTEYPKRIKEAAYLLQQITEDNNDTE